MPNRYASEYAILFKRETTYNVDAVPTGADNAILVSDLKIRPLLANPVNRNLYQQFLGQSLDLLGETYKGFDFKVEISASGTLGTAPAWSPILRACGFSQTINAGASVEYAPVSETFDSATIYGYDSGILHLGTGGRGNLNSMNLMVGEIPRFDFSFLTNDVSDTSVDEVAMTLTAFQKPKVVSFTNTTPISIGCTYNAGALSGGTAYPGLGATINLGNEVKFTELLGDKRIDVENRAPAGKVTFDLTQGQEAAFLADIKASTTRSLGFVHGTTAGHKILIFAPRIQLLNPEKVVLNGRRLISFDFKAVPNAGNDDLRIVCI